MMCTYSGVNEDRLSPTRENKNKSRNDRRSRRNMFIITTGEPNARRIGRPALQEQMKSCNPTASVVEGPKAVRKRVKKVDWFSAPEG